MTSLQKKQVEYRRGKGESYSVIAAALRISENTIKSYCRRNNLGAGCIAKQSHPNSEACLNCGKQLTHTPKAKKKRFCDDICRMSWWAAHPEAVNRKAVYVFTCASCGAEFTAYGNACRRYCSRTCFAISRRARHE